MEAKNTKKIIKESAVDKLSSVLREMILSGTWQTGEKIPTEVELSEQYGLNRMTVRAALQRLNALGILETRVGDGTYVRSFDFVSLIGNISDFYESPELMDSIGEFRQIVEGGAARLIIDRGTPEELEELRRICQELSAAEKRLYANYADPDSEDTKHTYELVFQFHEQLFKMTHNTLLYYAHAVSKDAVCKALVANGERRRKYFCEHQIFDQRKQHEVILAAIEAKDYERCRIEIEKYVGQEIDPY